MILTGLLCSELFNDTREHRYRGSKLHVLLLTFARHGYNVHPLSSFLFKSVWFYIRSKIAHVVMLVKH